MIDAMVYRTGWMLLHTVWQGAVVAAVLLLTLQLARQSISSQARYAISYLAMLLVVGAALTTLIHTAAPKPGGIAMTVAPAGPAGPTSPAYVPTRSAANPSAQWKSPAIVWLPWLVWSWAIGVALVCIRQFGGWMILQRCRFAAAAVERSLQVRLDQLAQRMGVAHVVMKLTDRFDMPMVIGLGRPVILAPISLLSDLAPHQIDAILAHELAHIRRFDYLANLVQVAVETLFFYHPCVWWISRQIRLERECCCDELASTVCGDRTEYVQALAALEQTRGPWLAPAMTGRGGRGELLARVRRLLGMSPASNQRGIFQVRSCVTSVILLSVFVILAARSTALRAQAPSTQPRAMVQATDPTPTTQSTVDYLISANDRVQWSITNLVAPGVEAVKIVRVSQSGTIALPLVGEIMAEGMTEAQLQASIAQAYRDKNIVDNAKVSVVVVQKWERGPTTAAAPSAAAPAGLDDLSFMRAEDLDERLRVLSRTFTEAQIATLDLQARYGANHPVPVQAKKREEELFRLYNLTLEQMRKLAATQPSTRPPATQAAAPSIQQERLQQLATALIDAQLQMLEMQAAYGPNHPRVVTARQSVDGLRTLFNDALELAKSR